MENYFFARKDKTIFFIFRILKMYKKMKIKQFMLKKKQLNKNLKKCMEKIWKDFR